MNLKHLIMINIESLLPVQIETILTVNPHATKYMITFKHQKTCIKYIIKNINDTYILARVNPPTACKHSINLLALDRAAHHSQQ
jgi:hypothetical protein